MFPSWPPFPISRYTFSGIVIGLALVAVIKAWVYPY